MAERDRHQDVDVPGEEPEDEFHLGKAAEEELKRLVTHPLEERKRLREEIEEGQTPGLALLLSRVAFWVWLLAALLMVLVFAVAYWLA